MEFPRLVSKQDSRDPLGPPWALLPFFAVYWVTVQVTGKVLSEKHRVRRFRRLVKTETHSLPLTRRLKTECSDPRQTFTKLPRGLTSAGITGF